MFETFDRDRGPLYMHRFNSAQKIIQVIESILGFRRASVNVYKVKDLPQIESTLLIMWKDFLTVHKTPSLHGGKVREPLYLEQRQFFVFSSDITLIKCLKGLKSQKSLFVSKF